MLISILIIISMEDGSTDTYALNNESSIDFATIETLGRSYSFEPDYTVLLNKNQILKNEDADDELINASIRTPVRGVFNSPDRDAILDFDAFLISENMVKLNYEKGRIEFSKQQHLVNLECNFNTTDGGCYTFYGEFPYQDGPALYLLVLVAYYDDYVKFYITKSNLG